MATIGRDRESLLAEIELENRSQGAGVRAPDSRAFGGHPSAAFIATNGNP